MRTLSVELSLRIQRSVSPLSDGKRGGLLGDMLICEQKFLFDCMPLVR